MSTTRDKGGATARHATTMADLKPGVTVRHIHWEAKGTIRVLGDVTEIRWDETFGEIEVSLEGPVFPGDLEITGEAS